METELTMEGAVKAYFDTIDESIKDYAAIAEFIDNAIDAGATKIDIQVNEETNVLRCIDNGKGMSRTQLMNYGKRFASSMGKCVQNMIGTYGVGSKHAFMALSNHKYGATASIKTYKDRKHVNCLWLTLNDNDEERFKRPTILDEHSNDTLSYESGTIITINNIKPIIVKKEKKNKDEDDDVITHITKIYSYLLSKREAEGNPLTISINGEVIKSNNDMMHLIELSDIIKNEGIYQIGNKYSVVVKYETFTNMENSSKSVKIPILGLLINKEYALKNPEENGMNLGGLYAMKGDRYVNYGQKASTSSRGGVGYARILIGADGNEELLGLSRNKSNGIDIDNVNLKKYINEDGLTLNDVFDELKSRFKVLNVFQTKNKVNRPISQELLEKAFQDKLGVAQLIKCHNICDNSISSNNTSREMNIALGNCDEDVTDEDIIVSANKIKDEILIDKDKRITHIEFGKNKWSRQTDILFTKPIFIGDVQEIIASLMSQLCGKYCSQAVANEVYNNTASLFMKKYPTSKLILANSVNAASR